MPSWPGLLVLLFLQILPGTARAGEFPWKAGDAPPTVAGVRLGDGRVRLEAVLGKPSSTEKLGDDALVLTYRQRGVQVIYASLDGAAIIFLQTREAGNIGGVRLGIGGRTSWPGGESRPRFRVRRLISASVLLGWSS